jgi:CBS domain-containing protein
MYAGELISPIIPVVTRLDSAARALNLMNEFHVAQLPVVEEDQYLCLLEEADILDWENPDVLLKNIQPSPIKPAVRSNAHFFEALKVAADYKLTLVPVIDGSELYVGSITGETLLFTLSHFNGIHEPGGILILEMGQNDFMLSEIARLAEAEEIYLLGVHTFNDPDTGAFQVLLKTNRRDLQSFVALLEQLNYSIKYRFDEPASDEELRKNYDLLMNYINM